MDVQLTSHVVPQNAGVAMLSSHALCSANVTKVEIVVINEKKVAAAQYLELEDSDHSDENAEN